MNGYIQREVYLQKLIDSRENGFAKVVTGPRRCGKSWLLTRLYKDYLVADGVPLRLTCKVPCLSYPKIL